MGRPSRTRLQSLRLCSCWGPSLPWLLQPQRLKLQLQLKPGTVATATVDTVVTDTVATVATVDTVATMATEKGLQKPSQSPLLQLPLTPTLMLMPGTVATATVDTVDTVATDTVDMVATVDTVATMATEKGLQKPSQSPLL